MSPFLGLEVSVAGFHCYHSILKSIEKNQVINVRRLANDKTVVQYSYHL